MTIKPIKTHEDYEAALAEVESLFEAESQEDKDRLEVLATLVEAYEAKQFPIAPPDPISAIEYEMEKRGLTRRALEPLIGHSGRVSEILNRQRPLTVAMIRNLHQTYGIPADILMAEYPTTRTSGGDLFAQSIKRTEAMGTNSPKLKSKKPKSKGLLV